jgi:hypothetical protein
MGEGDAVVVDGRVVVEGLRDLARGRGGGGGEELDGCGGGGEGGGGGVSERLSSFGGVR